LIFHQLLAQSLAGNYVYLIAIISRKIQLEQLIYRGIRYLRRSKYMCGVCYLTNSLRMMWRNINGLNMVDAFYKVGFLLGS